MVMSSQCDKMKKKTRLTYGFCTWPLHETPSQTHLFLDPWLYFCQTEIAPCLSIKRCGCSSCYLSGGPHVWLLGFAITALTTINPDYCFTYWEQRFVALLGFKAFTCWWVEAGLIITSMNITGVELEFAPYDYTQNWLCSLITTTSSCKALFCLHWPFKVLPVVTPVSINSCQ